MSQAVFDGSGSGGIGCGSNAGPIGSSFFAVPDCDEPEVFVPTDWGGVVMPGGHAADVAMVTCWRSAKHSLG